MDNHNRAVHSEHLQLNWVGHICCGQMKTNTVAANNSMAGTHTHMRLSGPPVHQHTDNPTVWRILHTPYSNTQNSVAFAAILLQLCCRTDQMTTRLSGNLTSSHTGFGSKDANNSNVTPFGAEGASGRRMVKDKVTKSK
jgi:hypothetical protein